MSYQEVYKLLKENNLKYLREKNGLTQKEVCNILQNFGVSTDRTAYSKYETGSRMIKCDVLIALAKYYDVSTDVILGFK